MNMKAITAGTAILLGVAPLLVASPARAADGWDWMVAPYLWAVNINTDAKTAKPPWSGSNDRTFNDVLDDLDGAFQMHVEGQGDRFGLFADFTYLGLAANKNFERFSTDTDLDSRLFEAAAVWNPSPGRFDGLDVFAGLRHINVDFNMNLYPVNPQLGDARVHVSQSWSDLMVGVRYTFPLADRWKLTLRGDGSWGDTDGTWNASAVVQYETKHGAWLFGYRYLDVALKDNDKTLNITLNGLEVGYGFKF